MKKIFAITMAFVLVLSIAAGCGKKSVDPTPDTNPENEAQVEVETEDDGFAHVRWDQAPGVYFGEKGGLFALTSDHKAYYIDYTSAELLEGTWEQTVNDDSIELIRITTDYFKAGAMPNIYSSDEEGDCFADLDFDNGYGENWASEIYHRYNDMDELQSADYYLSVLAEMGFESDFAQAAPDSQVAEDDQDSQPVQSAQDYNFPTDPWGMEILLDNTVVQLPCSVQAFEDAGWALETKERTPLPDTLAAGYHQSIRAEKGDGSIIITAFNTTDSDVNFMDAVVCDVEFRTNSVMYGNMNGNGAVHIVNGITCDSPAADFFAIYGEGKPNESRTSYTHIFENENGNVIRLEVKNDTISCINLSVPY